MDSLVDNHPLPQPLQQPLDPNVELLLGSRIPARVAWAGPGPTPRVVPIWFHWTGAEIVVATFAGSQKLRELSSGDVVAVTIDTNDFPYRALKIRGPIEIEPAAGLADAYRLAATRYLGAEMADRWCASLNGADQVAIRIRPTWASASDMSDSAFMQATS